MNLAIGIIRRCNNSCYKYSKELRFLLLIQTTEVIAFALVAVRRVMTSAVDIVRRSNGSCSKYGKKNL